MQICEDVASVYLKTYSRNRVDHRSILCCIYYGALPLSAVANSTSCRNSRSRDLPTAIPHTRLLITRGADHILLLPVAIVVIVQLVEDLELGVHDPRNRDQNDWH